MLYRLLCALCLAFPSVLLSGTQSQVSPVRTLTSSSQPAQVGPTVTSTQASCACNPMLVHSVQVSSLRVPCKYKAVSSHLHYITSCSSWAACPIPSDPSPLSLPPKFKAYILFKCLSLLRKIMDRTHRSILRWRSSRHALPRMRVMRRRNCYCI